MISYSPTWELCKISPNGWWMRCFILGFATFTWNFPKATTSSCTAAQLHSCWRFFLLARVGAVRQSLMDQLAMLGLEDPSAGQEVGLHRNRVYVIYHNDNFWCGEWSTINHWLLWSSYGFGSTPQSVHPKTVDQKWPIMWVHGKAFFGRAAATYFQEFLVCRWDPLFLP